MISKELMENGLENLIDVSTQMGASGTPRPHCKGELHHRTGKINICCFLIPHLPECFHGLSFLLGEVHRGPLGKRNQNVVVITVLLCRHFLQVKPSLVLTTHRQRDRESLINWQNAGEGVRRSEPQSSLSLRLVIRLLKKLHPLAQLPHPKIWTVLSGYLTG